MRQLLQTASVRPLGRPGDFRAQVDDEHPPCRRRLQRRPPPSKSVSLLHRNSAKERRVDHRTRAFRFSSEDQADYPPGCHLDSLSFSTHSHSCSLIQHRLCRFNSFEPGVGESSSKFTGSCSRFISFAREKAVVQFRSSSWTRRYTTRDLRINRRAANS